MLKMEQNQDHRKIQGGGTGVAFYLPHQIQRFEPILFQDILRESTRVARNNTPLADDLDRSLHERNIDGAYDYPILFTLSAKSFTE